ncbi:hypothetical protein Ancab_008418 [Ancistrocladus abbreviatus]
MKFFPLSWCLFGSITGILTLSTGNFTISSSHNKLVAIGCDDRAYLQGFRNGTAYWVGCMALCLSIEDLVNDTCNGIGCCETSIPKGVSNITTVVLNYYNHTYVGNFNPCSSAAVVANDAFVFSIANISTTAEEYTSLPQVPVVLNWTIGSKSCYTAKTDKTVLCNENSNCTDPPEEVGYRCQCWTGYEGNPYISPGCQEIDKCSAPELNDYKKPATCKNTNGGYKCKCPLALRGTGTNSDPCLPTVWLTVIAAIADEAKASQLTWEKRLNIAIEVASVLSHLHTKASPPILHRDMKSANILLLDNYTAKVVDFGCSRLVIRDSYEFERTIPSTYGYIDPEALVTGELTEKSDIYSFGVVLLELLTREKPQHLASHFLSNFDHHLFEILDEKIVNEQTTKQLKEVAHVARACLNMKGEERPTMREVEHELEGIKGIGKPHPWSYYDPNALQN